jgi:hypothetical protein
MPPPAFAGRPDFMADDKDKWKKPLWGKAKADFGQAQQPPPEPPAKAPEPGRGSEMVKKTKPSLDGPRPPGVARAVTTQAAFSRDWSKEAQNAAGRAPKRVLSAEDQREIDKLNAKFKRVAREQSQERGM